MLTRNLTNSTAISGCLLLFHTVRLEPPTKVKRPAGPAGISWVAMYLAASLSPQPPLSLGVRAPFTIQGPVMTVAILPSLKSPSTWAVFSSSTSGGV